MDTSERIRALVSACRADGVEVNDRNVVDLVLDNIGEIPSSEAAKQAIAVAYRDVCFHCGASEYSGCYCAIGGQR